ncbi:MAG: phosphogluconate dehydrogenase (NAD(+)-dependent, decarboxylating) [Terriglobia bacterium]
MKLGITGLGRMGANMGERLVRAGHSVVGHSRSSATVELSEKRGIAGTASLDELVGKLEEPRVLWMMIPAGAPVDATVQKLLPRLSDGDVIVDGGNSNFKDSMRRYGTAKERGVGYVDVGTSGGIWGLEEGYSMMVGGDAAHVDLVRPALESLAPGPERGWGHVGPAGSGHFAKMVHNGVEYGMMQAYAEGFDLLQAKGEFELDLHQVAEVWRYGSVVRSWLLDLCSDALGENPELDGIEPYVEDSGEGRWTVFESIDMDVPAPIISLSLMMRLASRDEKGFSSRLLAAMRNKFGGHSIKTSD